MSDVKRAAEEATESYFENGISATCVTNMREAFSEGFVIGADWKQEQDPASELFWKKKFEALRDACEGVPETLRQSAYLMEGDDEDGECDDVRGMARRLSAVLSMGPSL